MKEKKLINEIKEKCGDCEAWSGTDCTRNPYTQGCLKDEKKLTDEEIVKALEYCIEHRENCYLDCALEHKVCDDDNFSIAILDLIHRLQSENARLKTELSKELTEHEEFTKKAKAEIERLIIEKAELKEDAEVFKEQFNVLEPKYMVLEEKNAEQKAEIERLTEREKFLENAWKTSLETTETVEIGRKASEARNAELQKQVEELKKRLIDDFEKFKVEAFSKVQKQSVKDTAKEIFTDLLKEFSIRKSCGNADVVVREMATRKGVEVE